MEIGPISAIRPVAMVKPWPAAPDLSRVSKAEYLGQSSDDEYTPNRKADRGLEDEDEDSEGDDYASSDVPQGATLPKSVSLFA